MSYFLSFGTTNFIFLARCNVFIFSLFPMYIGTVGSSGKNPPWELLGFLMYCCLDVDVPRYGVHGWKYIFLLPDATGVALGLIENPHGCVPNLFLITFAQKKVNSPIVSSHLIVLTLLPSFAQAIFSDVCSSSLVRVDTHESTWTAGILTLWCEMILLLKSMN